MTSEDYPLITAVAVGVLASAILFKPFFGEKRDFWQCVGYALKPDLLSWLDKDLQRDYGKSMKLGLYVLLCVGAGFIAHWIAADLLKSS